MWITFILILFLFATSSIILVTDIPFKKLRLINEKKNWIHSIKRQERKVVYVTFRATEEHISKKLKEILTENNIEARSWNPNQLFDDPLKEVLGHIDMASTLIIIKPANNSPWTEAETLYATHTKKPIVSVYAEENLETAVMRVEEAIQEYWIDLESRFVSTHERAQVIEDYLCRELDEKTLNSKIWSDIEQLKNKQVISAKSKWFITISLWVIGAAIYFFETL